MGSKSRMRGRRRYTSAPPRLARGSSATIQPLEAEADSSPLDPSDAVPVRTDDIGEPYVRVAIETGGPRRADALSTWDAMCRVEQMLRERRGS